MDLSDIEIVFFGTPQLSVWALEEMQKQNIVPSIIVTARAGRAGRGRQLQEPPVKIWADTNNIKTLQPKKLDDNFISQLPKNSLFVVFAYGKILPQKLLDIPKFGSLNIHPSLLPKLRGPSPIRTAILNNEPENVGVSIILLDAKMDHGPIIAQEKYNMTNWPVSGIFLDEALSKLGGQILSKVLPKWLNNSIEPKEQNHKEATFCHFIQKSDALIKLDDNPYKNYLKILAFEGWPGAFFINKRGKRIKILKAVLENGELKILSVLPEGKSEMSFEDYKRGN